jgi:hypothetical protein
MQNVGREDSPVDVGGLGTCSTRGGPTAPSARGPNGWGTAAHLGTAEVEPFREKNPSFGGKSTEDGSHGFGNTTRRSP